MSGERLSGAVTTVTFRWTSAGYEAVAFLPDGTRVSLIDSVAAPRSLWPAVRWLLEAAELGCVDDLGDALVTLLDGYEIGAGAEILTVIEQLQDTEITMFKECLQGYSHACLGRRPRVDGPLLRLLQNLRGSQNEVAFAHIFWHPGWVRDKPLRERSAVEAEVRRLLGEHI